MEQQRLMLRVRVESGIPKLLVKINPSEAEGFSAKNLGEVKLRKASAQRGHVAVLHMSYGVPPGELVMSLKLAEILDVDEEEMVELTSALVAAAAATPGAAAPVPERPAPPASTPAAGGPDLGAAARESDAFRPGGSARVDPVEPQGTSGAPPDMNWFLKNESKYLPRRSSAPDGRPSAPWSSEGSAGAAEQPSSSGKFDFDWFRGGGLEQDSTAPWRGRSQSAFTPSSDFRGDQSTAQGQPFTSATSAVPPESLPRSSVPEASAAPEWLRDLRAFAEWDVKEANKPSVPATDFAGFRGGLSAGGSSSFSGGGQASDIPSGLGGGDLGAAQGLNRNSGLFEGLDNPASFDFLGNLRSRSSAAAVGEAPPVAGDASESYSQPRAREGEREDWPKWPFSWLDPSGQPLSSTGLEPLDEKRQSRLGGAAPSTLPAEAAPATEAGLGVCPPPVEVDSLPASECSDDGENCKAPRASRLKAGRREEAPLSSPADDLDSNPLGDLCADLSAATVDWRRSLERVAAEPSWTREPQQEACKAASWSEEPFNHSSSVFDAPTPQRAGTAGAASHGHPVASTVAESLEPSPVPSPRLMSRNSSQPSCQSQTSHASSCSLDRGATPVLVQDLPPKVKTVRMAHDSQASSRASSTASEERNEPPASSSSPPTSSPREEVPDQASAYLPGLPRALVPTHPSKSSANSGRSSRLLTKRKSVALGQLHASESAPMVLPDKPQEPRQPVSTRWRAPSDLTGCGLERSELGNEVTTEVRQWLMGETSGPQCSQVVLDRALTVLANFKLASGCQLEVLGGPLGAIVGGYSDADWLHDEVFRKQPAEAIRDAFGLLGFRGKADGDWSSIAAEEVSLAYRRLCLRGHPSRGGAPRGYLKLQVAMELIRAFSGEAGPLEPSRTTPRAKDKTPGSASSSAGDVTPPSRFGIGRKDSKDTIMPGFVLNDVALVRELQLTAAQAEEEASKIPQEQLEEMNRALDEYILRQMCFKSEIVDEIARLHEDCAYAILGVSSDATDSEIKKAYRLIARECHPDKGGDKEDFQELNNAYEKIMEQRKSVNDPFGGRCDEEPSDDDKPVPQKDKPKEKEKSEKAEKDSEDAAEGDDADGDAEGEKGEGEQADEAEEDEYGEEGSNASLVEKAGKAAEEASRYAKTAAEFAHQAAEAAETARRGREQGSRDTLTKSIAHSAIVLTLTVVKAVRVVGYATLDVAAQCRIAAKRNPNAVGCAERAVTAMSLGLEALNAALACAEVTETTAAELQAPAPAADGGNAASSTAAAERFVGAAVRASLAAASASNAAMSAAIAAVEGSRECARAVEEQQKEAEAKKNLGKEGADGTPETAEDGDMDDEGEDAESAEPKPPRPPPPTAEEAAAASTKRLVAQRNNNHKVLQRLNAEILNHQQNVRQFLTANRQLIPKVSGEAKRKVFGLLQDYSLEARIELERLWCPDDGVEPAAVDELLSAIRDQSMLTPFAQDQAVAIPVSVKARVLKMAALYDLGMTMQVLEQEIFNPIRDVLPKDDDEAKQKLDKLCKRIHEELELTSS